MFYGSSFWWLGLVYSVRMWDFLIILTYFLSNYKGRGNILQQLKSYDNRQIYIFWYSNF